MYIIETGKVYKVPNEIIQVEQNLPEYEGLVNESIQVVEDYVQRLKDTCIEDFELELRFRVSSVIDTPVRAIMLNLIKTLWSSIKKHHNIDKWLLHAMKPSEVGDHTHGEVGGSYDLDHNVGVPCTNCHKFSIEFLTWIDQYKEIMNHPEQYTVKQLQDIEAIDPRKKIVEDVLSGKDPQMNIRVYTKDGDGNLIDAQLQSEPEFDDDLPKPTTTVSRTLN